MAPKNKIDLTFTDFLYAVVAGSAFQRFDPYSWGWNETIILVALLILADDWVLYHAQASLVESTPRRFAFILVLDIFILLLWYSTALSGEKGVRVPMSFLFFLSGFYLVIAVGELAFIKQTGRAIRMWTEFGSSAFLSLAGFSALGQLTGPKRIFAFSILVLVVIRIKAWRTIVFHRPSEDKERMCSGLRFRDSNSSDPGA